jgi:hypothetical protein
MIFQWRWPKTPVTALADYGSTLPDLTEEWLVVRRSETSASASGYPDVYMEFIVWYQDGLGRTYYDDNNGQDYHVGWKGHEIVIY